VGRVSGLFKKVLERGIKEHGSDLGVRPVQRRGTVAQKYELADMRRVSGSKKVNVSWVDGLDKDRQKTSGP